MGIPVLVNDAFITLLERKILGLRQIRKGPNKVRIIGLAQPFRDAIKLFTKEILHPSASNPKHFLVAPITALIIVIITINVFPVIIRGWSSNRKYALIGRLRGIAQTVSYEVSFALILLFFLGLCMEINLLQISQINSF